MRAGIDRRSHEATRVPLDLWVRLAHEDYEEPFDADAVDLSAGGLALKSDFLPEVGDRLRCRFDCPPEGGEIEVDGEVVWAHDAGERSGEFGLRFGRVDEVAEESLRRLVEHLGGSASGRPLARLHLDGVASPIDAEILDSDGGWMTVEQELPFLRIGMGVAVEGANAPPRGRLATVDLRIVDGTPRLVLGVELDAFRERADDSVDGDDADRELEDLLQVASDTTSEPEPVTNEETLQDYDPPDAVFADHARESVDARESAQLFALGIDEEDDAEESLTPDAEENFEADKLALLRAKLGPAWTKTKSASLAAYAKAKPAVAVLWTKVVALLRQIAEKGGPRTKAAWAKTTVVLSALFGSMAARIGSRKAKRRTTAAPPKRVADGPRRRRQKAEDAVETPKKKNRRILVLGALAFAAVAAIVAFFSSGDAEAPIAPAAAPPALVAPGEPLPAPLPASPPAPAVVAPAPVAPEAAIEEGAIEDVVGPTPEAPAIEAGQLGAPTYPTLAETAEAARGEVTEGETFGADAVTGGRTATIRMSQTVTTIRGQRQSDGFTVTVPGALALDRAGPLAAANPSVERAMILNRGDHAVLTVRFVAGRAPPYRVVARGHAIEVTIGR
jgi:hypothetical protein